MQTAIFVIISLMLSASALDKTEPTWDDFFVEDENSLTQSDDVTFNDFDLFTGPDLVTTPKEKTLDLAKLEQCTAQHLDKRRSNKKKRRRTRKKSKTAQPSFFKVNSNQIKANDFIGTNLEDFKGGLRRRIKRCKNQKIRPARFGGRQLTRHQYCYQTSKALLRLANRSQDMNDLFTKAKKDFDFYRHDVVRKCKKKSSQKEIRFTSYYHPTVYVSKTPTDKYRYPIYKAPPNIKSLRRRGQSPTRQEIIDGKLKRLIPRPKSLSRSEAHKRLIVGYTANPFDIYNAQIQGSFLAKYVNPRTGRPTNQTQNLGYATGNGHMITFFGPVMKCMGVPVRYWKNLATIRKYFEHNPSHLPHYMKQDDHYVFFTEKNHANGSFAKQLVGGHSLAVDPARMPYGAIGFVNSTRPIPDTVYNEAGDDPDYHPFSTFALLDDTGSAIKGGGCQLRGDYYAGNGANAEPIASAMHQLGQIYLMLPKRL